MRIQTQATGHRCWQLLVLLLAGCNAAPSGNRETTVTELSFGIISTESTAGLKTGFDPFLEDMSAALGMPVKAFFAPDYAGIIEGMRFNKVDIAWYGNKSAIEAVDRAGGEVFAQTVAADGSLGYWSVIIVHKDSPYKKIEDLIADGGQLAFGNGDPNSTSGYLVPSYFLWAQRGIDPTQHFRRIINSNHEANILAVANKQVDCATNNTENLGQIAVRQPQLARQLRVIWKSPIIPNDPMVWRKNLPDDLKRKLRKFFQSYGRDGPDAERQRAVLAQVSSGWAPFRDSSNDQLLPIRELILATKLLDLERRGEADAEAQAEMVEIEEQLTELRARREKLERAPAESED